ncbi:hypothetical protein C2845_PM01G44450 [Panicum miliaceum]|uniref:Transposase (putative) gypsy type domain-containing protein n=1 Tax=Panicum miliaceum TaxID=4540 RepID=A0A3L6TE87_PANMI|nr:hypothetical protein C2845_PM01G44450 [Panicum miliaceum]
MVRRGYIAEGLTRALGADEVVARPEDDEVVVFRNLFTACLWFPLDPSFVEILRSCSMFLHHLTPNSIAQLSMYMWLVRTCNFTPLAEHFSFMHQVHYQPKVVNVKTAKGEEAEDEIQYSCYNFTYKSLVSSPVTAYKNKWPMDWTSHWFYHKVTLDLETRSHPLVTDRIRNLGDTPRLIAEETEDHLGFVAMLRPISKVFSTWDNDEEYVSCRCWPVKSGWSIRGWLPKGEWIEGIPTPDLVKSFCLKKNQVDPTSVESWADEILGAESNEYKLILKQLGGTRTNRVFHALGISVPARAASVRHKAAEEKHKAKAVTAVSTVVAEENRSAPPTAQLEKHK